MTVNRGYQHDDINIIDYALTTPAGSKVDLRGPVPDLDKPYIVALGAAQTFGRFVERPYSAIIQEKTGMPVLNLGMSGAGPSFFLLRPELMSLINRSVLAIVQVMSGRSTSNSRMTVEVNQGVVRPVNAPKTERAEFAETAYIRLLGSESPQALSAFRAEIRARALAEMCALLDGITVPRIALWFSKRTPNYAENLKDIYGYWGDFPHFLNQGVLDAMRPHCEDMAIAVSSDGLPQPLFDRKTGEPVVLWGEDMFPHVKLRSHNHYYPSPEMHVAAAEALAGPVASLLAAPAAVRAASQPARRREVLAHIHIFKNAGTSLDELFHRSFGTAFKAVDPEHEADVWSEEELLEVVRADPRLLCISSHQIRQPLIGDSRIKILPYFLIRHPISRLKSVYEYLRQQAQPDRISEMAQTLAFKTFVQTCQGFPNTERLVRNFQTGVLGRSGALEEQRRDRRWEWHQPVGEEHLLEALKFMESVPTVGVVERLEDSVAALCAAYALRFPQLGKHVFHANRSQEFKPLPEQLDEIREEVGAEFYDRLLQQNAMDLALWDAANRRLP